MGTCIGQRNYKYFVIHLVFIVIYAVIVACLSFYKYSIYKNSGQFGSIGMGIFALIMLVIIGNFVGVHCQLILRNETTHEYLKQKFAQTGNPHDSGWKENLRQFFCSKQIPSLIIAD